MKRRNDENSQAPSPPAKHTKPVATNVYQDPLPILSVQKASPPKPPPTTSKPKKNPPINSSNSIDSTSDNWESFDEDTVFQQNTETDNRPTTSKHERSPHAARHNVNTASSNSIKKDNSTTTKQPLLPGKGVGRGLVLDLNQVKLKSVPKAPPRIVKPSPDNANNSGGTVTPTPRAPPRIKRGDSNKGAQTPVTPISIDGIDDMCQNMDNIIAGLDDRLNDIQDNYVDESQLPSASTAPATKNVVEKPEKPIPVKKPSITHKRPILPPRPPSKDGSSTSSEKQQDTMSSSRKTSCTPFVPLPLKNILWKKLRSEGVQIHETPYTTTVNLFTICAMFGTLSNCRLFAGKNFPRP